MSWKVFWRILNNSFYTLNRRTWHISIALMRPWSMLNIPNTIPIMAGRSNRANQGEIKLQNPDRIEHNSIARPTLGWIVVIQLLALSVIGCLLILFDQKTAVSALAGGLIQIGPQAWFNRQAFRYTGARRAPYIVRSMYWGITGKWVLTIILFGIAFSLVERLNFFALLTTFAVMLVVHLILAHKVVSARSHQ